MDMIEKQTLLNKAFQKTGEGSGFESFAQYFTSEMENGHSVSANKTLFSALSAIIKAAPEGSLPCIKSILEMVEISTQKNFLGTKTEYLKRLIKLLFYEGATLLPDIEFKGYDRADYISYIEVCRRVFFVLQAKDKSKQNAELEKENQKKSLSLKNPEFKPKPISNKTPEKVKNQRWMNDIMAVSSELLMNNRECAQFVIEHKNERLYKGLVKNAEQVLKGGK